MAHAIHESHAYVSGAIAGNFRQEKIIISPPALIDLLMITYGGLEIQIF